MKKILNLLLIFLSLNVYAYDDKIFTPTNYVNDFAGVLSQTDYNIFNENLKDYNDKTSVQIAVIIIDKLEDLDNIEDFSQHIFNEWKIGNKYFSKLVDFIYK